MLRKYAQKLYKAYQNKGLVHSIRTLGKTFPEYLIIELNHIKLRQIQGNNSSRNFAEFVTELPFSRISDGDLEKVIDNTGAKFLNKVK